MNTGDGATGNEPTGNDLAGNDITGAERGSRGAAVAPGATLRADSFASADHLAPSVSQQRMLEHAASDHGPLLVYGGPSTGKTTLTVELAVRHLEAEHGSHRLTVLSPSRVAAARVRESMARSWSGSLTEQPSRSWASYAFWLIGEARRRGLLTFPARTPRLLSGAEQDRIIAELLQESRHTGSGGPVWPAGLSEALGTDGFRKEVRELFDRVTEYGLGPARLRELGEWHSRQEWVAAAELYDRYLDYLDQAAPDAFDPSGLISTACRLLEEHPELLEAERDRLKLLLVDDAQEMNPGMYRLLRLVGAGGPVVAFASPDTAVQGFRGAQPELLANWSTDRGLQGASVVSPAPEVLGLAEVFGESPEVSQVYGRIVRRIGVTGSARLARTPWKPAEEASSESGDTQPSGGQRPSSGCHVHVLPAEHLREQMVLHTVLERHHRYEVPLEQIAVISRSGSTAQRISRMFQSHGVPVSHSMNDVVLHREPAVEPLLRVMTLAVRPGEETPGREEDLLKLLGGVYGETNSLQLRRLRQELLSAHRALGTSGEAAAEQGSSDQRSSDQGSSERGNSEQRSSEQLLIETAQDAQHPVLHRVLDSHVGFLARGLQRVARMVRAGQEAFEANPQGVGPEEVLWAVWEASEAAENWAERTRHPGPEGRRADQDLDAVMALFQSAERFADQNPGAPAAAFVDYLNRIELPMDTLADTSQDEHAVQILTPATAAGLHFDTVVLVGLQQNVWPNVQLRGQLLGTAQLSDVLEGRTGPERLSPRVKQMQVLQDEYRLLAAAVSRARSTVIGIAVDTADTMPSSFADLIEPPAQRAPRETPIPRPLTAGSLISELRRHLESTVLEESVTAQQENDAAARSLALLQQAGLPGADPAQWWGLPELSSEDPIVEEDEEIRISPSSVRTALESPVQWFTEAAGGVEPTDFSRQLGTVVHAVAETHPAEPDAAVLIAELDRHWHELGLGEGWIQHHERRRAVVMLEKLALYYRDVEEEGRRSVAQELQTVATVDLDVGDLRRRVKVSGVMDRVERTADGQWYVVDLKTGATMPSADEMGTFPQLGLYQLLIREGALNQALAEAGVEGASQQETAGAAILNVGKDTNKYHELHQPPVDDADLWPYDQLRDAAEVMSGSTFASHHHAKDNSCRAGVLCPLCENGKQVTEP